LLSFSSLLAKATNDLHGHHDLDLGGLNLASFVLTSFATTCDPFGHSLHVDHCLFLCSLLVVIVSDLLGCLGGLNLTFLTCAYNSS